MLRSCGQGSFHPLVLRQYQSCRHRIICLRDSMDLRGNNSSIYLDLILFRPSLKHAILSFGFQRPLSLFQRNLSIMDSYTMVFLP
jgi:hypothetical protein